VDGAEGKGGFVAHVRTVADRCDNFGDHLADGCVVY
jgi:hypothetical protein